MLLWNEWLHAGVIFDPWKKKSDYCFIVKPPLHHVHVGPIIHCAHMYTMSQHIGFIVFRTALQCHTLESSSLTKMFFSPEAMTMSLPDDLPIQCTNHTVMFIDPWIQTFFPARQDFWPDQVLNHSLYRTWKGRMLKSAPYKNSLLSIIILPPVFRPNIYYV